MGNILYLTHPAGYLEIPVIRFNIINSGKLIFLSGIFTVRAYGTSHIHSYYRLAEGQGVDRGKKKKFNC